MKTSLSVLATFVIFFSFCFHLHADDLADIKALVPAATSVKLADFDRIARSETAPKPSDIEAKSLTWILFCSRILPEDEKANAEFGVPDAETPKPSEIASEICRFVRGVGRFRFATGPVTMIHKDRITDITGKVEGDTATGIITYKVPELYFGQVHYVANRKDGKWQIDEFKMPARKVHIVRGENGVWELKSDG
jgi:hypothetical protein